MADDKKKWVTVDLPRRSGKTMKVEAMQRAGLTVKTREGRRVDVSPTPAMQKAEGLCFAWSDPKGIPRAAIESLAIQVMLLFGKIEDLELVISEQRHTIEMLRSRE